MAEHLIEMGRGRKWSPYLGKNAAIKGFPAETIGLSVLGALAAVGIDKTINLTSDQVKADQGAVRTNDVLTHVVPSFLATTALAGATWWLSGSKTAAFVIEAVALAYFVPKVTVAIFE